MVLSAPMKEKRPKVCAILVTLALMVLTGCQCFQKPGLSLKDARLRRAQ